AYRKESDTPICDSRSIVVVGGGNVALDSARCARRVCDGDVSIVYRRSEAEMPARLEEVHHAKEEGILMRLLTNPVRFVGDANGRLIGVDCVEMELGEPDASGRRRPVEKPDSLFRIDTDTAIVAIGTSPNPLLRRATEGLSVNRHGAIIVDPESGMTSIPGVFAGGDIVSGDSTVILAMGAGKQAAAGMDAYIKSRVPG
ncbi:MAG TPA: FAD-dependent oxidoreductase, partial [Clostridia bacterium]